MSRIRSGLHLVPDELDQVIRLARFRERHPDVIVGDGGFGTMQALIPKPDGEIVVTRYILRELLDKLDELLLPDSENLGRGAIDAVLGTAAAEQQRNTATQ